MTTAINVLMHIFLAGSLVVFSVALSQLVWRDPEERVWRGLALVAGGIVAASAQAGGEGYAPFIVDALTGPVSFLVGALAVVIPGGLGALLSWYLVRVLARNEKSGFRYVCFVGMLTVIAYLSIYATATETEGVTLGAAALPNASFVVATIVSLLIQVDRLETGGRSDASRAGQWLLDWLRGRRAGKRDAPPEPTAPPTTAPPPQPRNPFARHD